MKSRIIHTLFLLFICTALFSQEMRFVSGVIKDSDGEPIIGVNVQEKGAIGNLTITNLDGYYEIEVPLGSKLQFSYIGMRTTEMLVTAKNSKPSKQAPGSRRPTPVSPKEKAADKSSESLPGTTIQEEPEEPESRLIEYETEYEEVTPSREGQSLSPYFIVKSSSPEKAWMPLNRTDVTVNIAGIIADVCVKQIYTNLSDNTLEAIYVFPGSTRAAVYGMTMTVGDRRIEARIKKKEEARKEYEEAKEQGKSATLLEQHRPNVFQMNVANILPGDTIIVEMRYTELLEHEAGVYEFVYPTVVGPRYTETGERWVKRSTELFDQKQKPEFTINTTIQAGMPIQKISSTSHNVSIVSPSVGEAVVSLANPKDNQGDRDYILQYELQGGQVTSGLLRYEHGDENFFLLMVQPPKKPTTDQIPPREYIFIVDVSGSMYGFPLDVSKKLIRNLASSLRPIDRFNVMLFESNNEMLHKESVAATPQNINKALKVIDKQQGSGGTSLYPALVKAMKSNRTPGFSRTFIIATDGFVSIDKEAFNYVRDHLNEANLFPFGIGRSVNRYLIEGLAHAGMGTPYIVTNHTEAEEIGKKVIKEISQPVLTDISVDWGDFDVYDVEPVGIPDVFAERPILIYGKYKGAARGTISVSGVAGNKRYKENFDVSKADQKHNQALRYLWARNQIRYYDDYAQYYEGQYNGWSDLYGNHQRSSKQIEYVTNLGLKYNLLTQYTSFLAVDHRVRQPRTTTTSRGNNLPVVPHYSTPEEVTTPDLNLAEDASELEEVVVVGYGTNKRTSTTASVSQVVSNNAIGGSSGSLVSSLQGRLAGLQVSQPSGEPGDPSRIRIRGVSSVMDNNNPLIILDGVPIEQADMSGINPADIENVTILKGSAAAIYGTRGMNGVILITSKKLAYKKLSVQWSSSFSVETPNRLPELQNRFAQGRPKDGNPVWNTSDEPFSWGPDVASVKAPTYDAFDILQTGYSFRNHLTLSGRRRGYLYSFKLGNNTQRGFIPESKFNQTSIGLTFGSEKNRKFDYEIDLAYKNTKGNRLQRGYNMSGIMKGILLTPPTFDNRVSTSADGQQRLAGNAADNPYWMIDNNPFSDKADRFKGSLKLNYKPIHPLSFNYLLSADYMKGNSETALNKGSVSSALGRVMNRDEKFRSLQSKLSVMFNKSWNEFDFTSMLAHEYTNSKRDIDRLDGYKLAKPGDYNVQHTDSIVPFNKSYDRYANSAFGRVGLSYRQTFFAEMSMRGEWSSLSSKTLLSPFAGIGVNFNNLFDTGIFDLLKLYVNVSRNDKETPLYLDPTYFNSAMHNLNDASNHFESREVIADNLLPETIDQYEVGTNMALLNNRINFSASWYWKRGKNQLLPVQVSTSSVRLENAGTFKTNGFEVELMATLVNMNGFLWSTQFTFSRERSRITSLGGRKLMLAGIEGVAGSYAIEGQPLGVLYGTSYERDQQGRLLIGDDGFPLKSDKLKVLGDPNPDWRLSWINSFVYRNFSLSILLDFKKGGKMWNGTANVMNYYGTSQHSADHRHTTNHVFAGVLQNGQANTLPVDFYGSSLDENRWVRYGEYGVAEDAIQDASYLKLREIALGYSFPVNIFKQRTRLKLSAFATNILLYSKYKGVDPETNLTGSSNGFGLDYFNIPGVQSIGISLNWEF